MVIVVVNTSLEDLPTNFALLASCTNGISDYEAYYCSLSGLNDCAIHFLDVVFNGGAEANQLSIIIKEAQKLIFWNLRGKGYDRKHKTIGASQL